VRLTGVDPDGDYGLVDILPADCPQGDPA